MSSVPTQLVSLTAAAEHPATSGTRLAYCIAGISFGIKASETLRMKLDRELRDFVVQQAVCDVNIRVSLIDSLRVPSHERLFDSGGLWSLFAENGGYRLNFRRWFRGESPYKSAWFDEQFRDGELSLSRRFFSAGKTMYPLEYPLDEVLMIHHLACGKGIEVHALGVADEAGRGHLFLGHSGAGKSTSARLWQKEKGIRILSDDRIILRVHDGQIRMHGTPWHGDAGIASPGSAQLTHIYVLEQWPSNELVPMSRSLATAEIFARSFVPRHCPQALDQALGFIEQLSKMLPCHTFRFLPDRSAVEVIRNAQA